MRLLISACGIALVAVTLLLTGLGLRSGFSLSGWVYVTSFGAAGLGALVPRLRKSIYVAATLFLLTWTFRTCETRQVAATSSASPERST